MGFVLLGIGAVTLGISGAIPQMISHGLIAAAMFFVLVLSMKEQTLFSKYGRFSKGLTNNICFLPCKFFSFLALPGMSGS